MMEWKNVWKEEPPRYEEILFMTGDGSIHVGMLYGVEKLRKCYFMTDKSGSEYDADTSTSLDHRVMYWLPIPPVPKENKDAL